MFLVLSNFAIANGGCSEFGDKYFTTADGVPVANKAFALSSATDTVSLKCTYTAIINKLTYSQYDSSSRIATNAPLDQYIPFIPNADSVFRECYWKSNIENGKNYNECLIAQKDVPNGRGWCDCKYNALKIFGLKYSDIEMIADANSGLHGQIMSCWESGAAVEKIIIASDSSQVIIPAYRDGTSVKINISISGYEYSFLFDTGASYLTINRKIYKRLLQNNNITTDALPDEIIETATGAKFILPIVVIKEFKIGDVNIENTKAAIMNDTSATLLFGTNILKKFKSYSVHDKPLRIILEKE